MRLFSILGQNSSIFSTINSIVNRPGFAGEHFAARTLLLPKPGVGLAPRQARRDPVTVDSVFHPAAG